MTDVPSRPISQGKSILITGASTGIGAAAARAFARFGCKVGIHYNASRNRAEEVAADVRLAGGQAHLVGGDFNDSAAVRRVIDEAAGALGGIDILVNNAGGLVRRVPIAEIDDAFFDEVIDLNVRSVVMATRGGHAAHAHAPGAATSSTSRRSPRATAAARARRCTRRRRASSSTFTRGIAKELVKDNIRVNAVSPGVIATPFHERYSTPQMLETFKGTIPMGRLGTADECAGAFVYLASDALSGYVTGQIIEVNGGQYMP